MNEKSNFLIIEISPISYEQENITDLSHTLDCLSLGKDIYFLYFCQRRLVAAKKMPNNYSFKANILSNPAKRVTHSTYRSDKV